MSTRREKQSSSSRSSTPTTPAPSVCAPSATSQLPAPSAPPASTASSNESLICRWSTCSLNFVTPEALYEHLCASHVGHKSTNNPSLICQWGSCYTPKLKRDHMTSHIRVHVPLWPHKCDFCGRSFKRPHDLKKHTKTHPDGSVTNKSPQDQAGLHGVVTPGTELEAKLPPGMTRRNDHNGHMRTASGSFPHQAPGHANYDVDGASVPAPPLELYYAPRGQEYLGHHTGSFDTHNRGYDVVDDVFGSVKHRAVDPLSYASVGRSLLPLHEALALQPVMDLPAPGYMALHRPDAAAGGGHVAPSNPASFTQQYYMPPMSNARTKNDLVQLGHILDQIRSTVYENGSQAIYPVQVHDQTTTSTVSTNLGNDGRLTYSGGMLQRAKPSFLGRTSDTPAYAPIKAGIVPTCLVGAPPSESDVSDATRERQEKYDVWLENIRIIDALRKYIRDRISRQDFVEAEEADRIQK